MNIFDVMEQNGINENTNDYNDLYLLKEYSDIPDFREEERLITEKETTGIYISGQPLNKYFDFIKKYAIVKLVLLRTMKVILKLMMGQKLLLLELLILSL